MEDILYEVFVSSPGKPREMFKFKTSSEDDLIEEINRRYSEIYECTAIYYDKDYKRFSIRFNIVDGRVVK